MEDREPSYSDWKPVKNADRQIETHKCEFCFKKDAAKMMTRYYTDRNGEKEQQYRVECPLCKTIGKTFLHKSVALLSWKAQEVSIQNTRFPK